jgi:hypothetical protein
MTLGDLLVQLQDPSEIHQLLAEAGNIKLVAKLNEAAKTRGCDPCDAALRAVDDFALHAEDEAWLRLVGLIQDADAPAATCLNEMISWSLGRVTTADDPMDLRRRGPEPDKAPQ